MKYEGKRVLVTGGCGFIGSNLAIALANLGARVTVIDPSVLGCGGNRFNLEPAAQRIDVIENSIADTDEIAGAIRGTEVVFNLAGEISHIHSMLFPERDLKINAVAQLRFLRACERECPGARIVYAGTRQVYGIPEYLPVDEGHPVNPVDFNGIHKYAATQYHLMLSRMGRLDAVVLRLTNVYGPRMALNVPCQGFFGTYFRRAVTGQELDVFGDGSQLRDPIFVDDVVATMLTLGCVERLPRRAYNLGGAEALSLLAIAETISRAAGLPAVRTRPFPEDRKPIDIGSYYTDSSRIRSELNCAASVGFGEGVVRTLAYYRAHKDRYLDSDDPNPECTLEHRSMEMARLKLVPS